MRNFIRFALLAVLAALISSCGRKAPDTDLIVYYSQTGNTEILAKLFAEKLNADIFRLECETPYPDSFEETIEESRKEIEEGLGRTLVNAQASLDAYRTIYIGYPVWFGTIPPPLTAFIAENDLQGRNIVLFCTYGSGGVKSSTKSFKTAVPDCNLLGSYGIAARRLDAAGAEVDEFLANLGKTDEQDAPSCSEPRPYADTDQAIFIEATEGYGYLHLTPVMVAVEEKADGSSVWFFTCESSMREGMPAVNVEACIVKPAEGKAYLKSMERL
ncbi:MAG: hypothetical protein J5764_04775 [Bacteroidales bacterium]|nr:hypothetical protein [Bacteroidales bacterium]